jgi:predicted alpha/beta-fold hydrolase
MHPPPDFRPLPFLANAHLQTILGAYWPGSASPGSAQEHRVLLPDGDQLVLHDSRPPRWETGQRIALLVHGLGGSHRSPAIRRLAGLLFERGLRVVRIDLRGAGRGEALARRGYHGGCSDDVRAALTVVGSRSPASPLILVGLSLGGNIVLKLAGETSTYPVPGLERVAAVSPPIDMVRCSELLALPRNRFYDKHYAHTLVEQVRRRQRLGRREPPIRFPRRLTLRLFDELYTAPRCGFADALDYYRRASALPVIPAIAVPTFILTARDDPFIAVTAFEALKVGPHIKVWITERGGHLGFLGWDGSGGVRWAERRVVEWVVENQ